MSALAVALTLVLLAAVMAVVSRPLFSAPTTAELDESDRPERAELEAVREAKYREIRDTEFDYRTGKLSAEDYKIVDGTLRSEAVQILDRLDLLERETAVVEEVGANEESLGATAGGPRSGETKANDEQERARNSTK